MDEKVKQIKIKYICRNCSENFDSELDAAVCCPPARRFACPICERLRETVEDAEKCSIADWECHEAESFGEVEGEK